DDREIEHDMERGIRLSRERSGRADLRVEPVAGEHVLEREASAIPSGGEIAVLGEPQTIATRSESAADVVLREVLEPFDSKFLTVALPVGRDDRPEVDGRERPVRRGRRDGHLAPQLLRPGHRTPVQYDDPPG